MHTVNDINTWIPSVGEETMKVLATSGLTQKNFEIVKNEAIDILSKCVSPSETSGHCTGLVVGYIQSGKTLSFTTVTALARDNNFQIVIVIAGTSVSLTNQSRMRLINDLQLDDNSSHRRWRHFAYRNINDSISSGVANVLSEWKDASVQPNQKRTVLITAMKHHGYLQRLVDDLNKVPLSGVPVLIIDDEADQAGLNNLIKEGEESTTYQRLKQLKESIPHHSFLQYTATPQGPLFINLVDVLSPDFATTLSPGRDYTGGKHFFQDHRSLIREIPASEVDLAAENCLEPPASLLEALRVFFLGVAIGVLRDGGRGNRSMMIHPSQKTTSHEQYHRWVKSVCGSWRQILGDSNSPDRQKLIRYFQDGYTDLGSTIDNLNSFEELSSQLLNAIRLTEIHEVNARTGKTPQIDWTNTYSNILIGGQALDRGFTVEGLTVTYMPRGVGARRADTLQQRARFFGYKKKYIGFCRVFLEAEVASAFMRYIEHEEDFRTALKEHETNGLPLSSLRRAFLLDRSLYPTRNSILDFDYVRIKFIKDWFYPKAPHENIRFVKNNTKLLNKLVECHDFYEAPGHSNRTKFQIHNLATDVSLRDVYENYLSGLQFPRLTDAQEYLGALVILKRLLSNSPDSRCTLYQMSQGRKRKRGIDNKNQIINLFQGANPVEPKKQRGKIYPGDNRMKNNELVTIQIHYLSLFGLDGQLAVDQVVPNIAIWIPPPIRKDVIVQLQQS